eukprot:1157796-Pelagomonas_calceolata.AAC.2
MGIPPLRKQRLLSVRASVRLYRAVRFFPIDTDIPTEPHLASALSAYRTRSSDGQENAPPGFHQSESARPVCKHRMHAQCAEANMAHQHTWNYTLGHEHSPLSLQAWWRSTPPARRVSSGFFVQVICHLSYFGFTLFECRLNVLWGLFNLVGGLLNLVGLVADPLAVLEGLTELELFDGDMESRWIRSRTALQRTEHDFLSLEPGELL